ncbi:hypothetical protein OPU71_18275 [Niveibacterium sp. 24ML]|nr:hypothetical protein [Niveibacterium sp. 24ML]MCX9158073.1 hypothetical protein [Niveibacterium sp. 24ML]
MPPTLVPDRSMILDARRVRFPVFECRVTLSFDSPWQPDRMSPAARAAMQ